MALGGIFGGKDGKSGAAIMSLEEFWQRVVISSGFSFLRVELVTSTVTRNVELILVKKLACNLPPCVLTVASRAGVFPLAVLMAITSASDVHAIYRSVPPSSWFDDPLPFSRGT